MLIITVLYEDERAQPKQSGPHQLLPASVGDRIGQSPWDLAQVVRASPKKGNHKLKAAIEQDFPDLRNSGPVAAVIDNDRARDCYGLPGDACKSTVLAAMRGDPPLDLAVVLLEDNVEDLLDACLDALGEPRLEHKPSPMERDTICERLAYSAGPVQRAAVVGKCPSFGRLVCVVERYLTARRAPDATVMRAPSVPPHPHPLPGHP